MPIHPRTSTINHLHESGEHPDNDTRQTSNNPLHEALRKVSSAKSPVTLLKFTATVRELFKKENEHFGETARKRTTTFELFAKAFNGKNLAAYSDLVHRILDSYPENKKLLFHSAIYANNLELVEYILRQDKSLIRENDSRGFSPYMIALAASAQQVEQFFYAHYADDIKKDTRLPLDFSEPQSTPAILKAAFIYENNSQRSDFETIIDELYLYPEFRPTLDIIAASLIEQRSADKKTIRVFIADADNVQSLTPKSTGYGDLDQDVNILRMGGKRERQEIKGTLIHEFTHLAALLTYDNGTKPYREGSKGEQQYKTAISQIDDLFHLRAKLNPAEPDVSKLLFERMESYKRREEAYRLHAGTLSDPEWLVSIPQAIVLYGNYYESADRSIIESRGMPMLNYWRHQFNNDVRNAFNGHPMRSHVTTSIADVNIRPEEKIMLTTTIDKIKEHILARRFELTGGMPTKGYTEGAAGQYRIVHQILMGNILDEALSRTRLPASILLTDARTLAEHPLLSSSEYNKAFQEIYNVITLEWKAAGKKKAFTIADINTATMKKISGYVPPELKEDLHRSIRGWTSALENRYSASANAVARTIAEHKLSPAVSEKVTAHIKQRLTEYCYLNMGGSNDVLSLPLLSEKVTQTLNRYNTLVQCIDHAISAITNGKSISKEDLTRLKHKIFDYLYDKLPADKNISDHGFESGLKKILLADNIIKPSALDRIGKLFDKPSLKVKLDDEVMNKSLQKFIMSPEIYEARSQSKLTSR